MEIWNNQPTQEPYYSCTRNHTTKTQIRPLPARKPHAAQGSLGLWVILPPAREQTKDKRKKLSAGAGRSLAESVWVVCFFFLFFLFDFLLYSILLYSALFCSVLFHSILLTLFYSKARHVRGGCMVLWRTREIILQYTAPPSPSFCCVGQCGGLLAVFFRARARALLGRLVTASVIFTY